MLGLIVLGLLGVASVLSLTYFLFGRFFRSRSLRFKVALAATFLVTSGYGEIIFLQGEKSVFVNGVPSVVVGIVIVLAVCLPAGVYLYDNGRGLYHPRLDKILIMVIGPLVAAGVVGLLATSGLMGYSPNSLSRAETRSFSGDDIRDRYENAVVILDEQATRPYLVKVTMRPVCDPKDDLQRVWWICEKGKVPVESFFEFHLPKAEIFKG